MVTKKIIIPMFAIAVMGTALLGASQVVNAQTGSTPTLVQMIAQKFGLDQSKVQSVFDQYKGQRQAMMQQRMRTRLDQLVTSGKITAKQEQDIIAEMAKLKSEYSQTSFKTLTADQRTQQMTKRQAEIQSWASSEGIDPSYLLPGFGRRHMGM